MSNIDGIVVTGPISIPWRAPCRRCLTDVAGVAEVVVDEVYQDEVGDDDAFQIEGDQIDLAPAVREYVLLELPDGPLCRDDCAGICPVVRDRSQRGDLRLRHHGPRRSLGSARRSPTRRRLMSATDVASGRVARLAGTLAGLLAVGSIAGCSRDDTIEAIPVARPSSVEAIVAATHRRRRDSRLDLTVGTDDLVVLRSTAVIDTASERAHRTAEGAVGSEFDSSDPPPLVDFGETWFVDGEVFELAPGDTAARPVGGDLADFLFVDSRDEPVDELAAVLAQLLEGWPPTTVSDAVLIGEVSTHHLRFQRPDGDVVDVWVDDRARIVRTTKLSERAAPLELRIGVTHLDARRRCFPPCRGRPEGDRRLERGFVLAVGADSLAQPVRAMHEHTSDHQISIAGDPTWPFRRRRSRSRRAAAPEPRPGSSSAPARSTCPRCGNAKTPHIVCPSCGWYKNRVVIDVG